jgi:voltage-dependent calcium channel T type alpha-1G
LEWDNEGNHDMKKYLDPIPKPEFGPLQDTLREECEDGDDCLRNCCVSPYFAPLFFVVFVLMAQFVLVNVVVAVLMKHLEESHKQVEHDNEF